MVYVSCFRPDLDNVVKNLANTDAPIGLELFYNEMPTTDVAVYQSLFGDLLACNGVHIHGPMDSADGVLLNPLADEGTDAYTLMYQEHENCFAFCQAMGIGEMVYHTNDCRTAMALNLADAQQRLAERLDMFTEMAKQYGVTLWSENVGFEHNNSLVLDQDAFIAFFQQNNQPVLLDTGHAQINGWDMPVVIEALKDQIKAYHIHDNLQQRDNHLPMGDGNIDWHAFFTAVKTHTPDAALIIEYAIPEMEIMFRDAVTLASIK